jgi:tRNA(Arg) A34 adenosine deaminase TadA
MCLGAIYWSGIKRVVYTSGRQDAAAAGFDDELIYNEISLDPSKRQVTFLQMEDHEAKEVFRKWEEYDGKTFY